jgi:hypothetical protein
MGSGLWVTLCVISVPAAVLLCNKKGNLVKIRGSKKAKNKI